jgi:catechol 2,3-dioxygenase-like lactoylglutathione lyase family enzyme
MAIYGVEQLIYGVEDLEKASRFQDDWGMQRVASGVHGTDFRLLNDTTVHLREAADDSLPPATIRWLPHLMRSTLREAIWGVDTAAALDAIGAELSRDREVKTDSSGVLHSVDDSGFHIGFMVSKRKHVVLEATEVNTLGSYARRNRQADGVRRRCVSPYKAGHLVYWLPDKLDEAARFYVERLGFRPTDNSPDSRFMRSSGSNDHHTLLLQQRDDTWGFQHVAYEYKDIDEVMMAGCRMEEQGWKTNTGPIRHNISSSFSWYLWNPAGGVSEAYCDMDYADDNWVVGWNDPKDPEFYGVSWAVRPPGPRRARPAEWIDD